MFCWNLSSPGSCKWLLFLLSCFRREVTINTISVGRQILSVSVMCGGSCFKYRLNPVLNCSKADTFHRQRCQSYYMEHAGSPSPLFEIVFLCMRLEVLSSRVSNFIRFLCCYIRQYFPLLLLYGLISLAG